MKSMCDMLKKGKYGTFQDEQLQELRSRLLVCKNDRACHQWCLMVKNDYGSDGVEHRSIL